MNSTKEDFPSEPDPVASTDAGTFRRILLGTAVGDSVGLPAEGLSRATVARRWHGEWRQRLVFGRGMVSDDTEHTVFVAQCLHLHPENVEAFQKSLARRFRWWLASLPPGVGMATARSILKLWLGFPPGRSGVLSAGNGPAMRSAIIGGFFAGRDPELRRYVSASTRLTHSDPKAGTAALAVALTASRLVAPTGGVPDFIGLWRDCGRADLEWQEIMNRVEAARIQKSSVAEFVHSLGIGTGVSGYAYQSVPVALYAWLHHRGDFKSALSSVYDCGGDTDSVGAICGGLAALESDIPDAWLDRLCDWPLSVGYLHRLAEVLAGNDTPPPAWRWALYPFRNLILLAVVLIHGFRRLFL